MSSSDVLQLDLAAIRAYCTRSHPRSGMEVLADAVIHGHRGAYELVHLLCVLRVNRRSRRTMGEVRREMTRPASQRPRWLRTLGDSALSLWRVLRRQVRPMHPVRQQLHLRHLPRDSRRLLRSSGLVASAHSTLQDDARLAARAIWDLVAGRQCVVWVDDQGVTGAV